MSTKIYYAYRMTPEVFDKKFLASFRDYVFSVACFKIKAGMERLHVSEEFLAKKWELSCKETNPDFVEYMQKNIGIYQLKNMFKIMFKASETNVRNHLDLDCSMNVWYHEGHMYCILYGNSDLHEGYPLPEGVENFAYWNNTDQPEGISDEDWDERGRIWDAIVDDWDAKRMTHVIIEAKERVGLVKIAQQILGPEREDVAWAILPYKQELNDDE